MKNLKILTPGERQELAVAGVLCSFDGCRGKPLYMTDDLGFMCQSHYEMAIIVERSKQ